MFNLSRAPSSTSLSDILHLSVALFRKYSWLMHKDFEPHEELIQSNLS